MYMSQSIFLHLLFSTFTPANASISLKAGPLCLNNTPSLSRSPFLRVLSFLPEISYRYVFCLVISDIFLNYAKHIATLQITSWRHCQEISSWIWASSNSCKFSQAPEEPHNCFSTMFHFDLAVRYLWLKRTYLNPEALNPLGFHCQGYKFEKHATLKKIVYQTKETLLLITTFPCLQVLASLIMKNKSKRSWDTEKFTKCHLKDKRARRMRTNQQVHRVCSSLRCISISPCTDNLPSLSTKAALSQVER